jgi:hypothetical protein
VPCSTVPGTGEAVPSDGAHKEDEMGEWFKAGGFGMLVILALGVASVAFGVATLQKPTSERLAAMRSLPGLIVTSALFAFGTNLWAVNVHLTNEAFVSARGIGAAELPFVAMMGFTEAGQALTLGGLLAFIVVALRLAADRRMARTERAPA